MHTSSVEPLAARSREIFNEQLGQTYRHTDRMFAALMGFQWIGAIVWASAASPRTWTGAHSELHPHLWLAIFFGGFLATFPVLLICRFPGRFITRQVVAISQVLFSSLLIHISGGRIETHFHVFGSLAFLAFYRDWRVLVPATLVVAVDHFVRGVFWPETAFGVATVSQFRWLEHAGWVLFEDVFLFVSIHQGVGEKWRTARHTAELEQMYSQLSERTTELQCAYQTKHAMLETSLDAVINMDLQGRIIAWNSEAERTFGWSAAEVFGKSLAEIIVPPQYRDLHTQGLARYGQTRQAVVLNRRIEVTALHRNGSELPVEVSIAPVGNGSGTTFCAFVRDITERHRTAEVLRRAAHDAEAASRAKTAFLAHMSHEIRTPLNGILGYSDMLLKLQNECSDAERREYLDTIQRSGRHLLDLINDVLDLSKIESGQMHVNPAQCSPPEIIAEVISILRVRAQDKGINLEYAWNGCIPETIVTDASRFRQLLINLIGNAIKFTENGGVDVVASVDGLPDDARLVIDIVDSGIGIAPKHIDAIFEPFVQADQSITRRFGGTGLGLAISRQIAELLGGDLKVRSELGRGSTFTLSIETGSLSGVRLLDSPVADLVPQRVSHATGIPQILVGSNILLVDDGVSNRKLFSLMLRRAGATVVAAENGQIGLECVAEQRFDVILMDMQMPVLDGYSAATELRRRGVTTPIIALTAHAMKGDEERCRDAGCSGYLTKPIESDRLLSAVAEAAGKNSRTIAPTSHTSSSPVVQHRLTSKLPTDDPEFCEIIDEFIDHLLEKMSAMQSALDCGDCDELASLAHWLKGAGGTAGFNDFTAPAAALEKLAKTKQTQSLPTALAELQYLCSRIERPSGQIAASHFTSTCTL